MFLTRSLCSLFHHLQESATKRLELNSLLSSSTALVKKLMFRFVRGIVHLNCYAVKSDKNIFSLPFSTTFNLQPMHNKGISVPVDTTFHHLSISYAVFYLSYIFYMTVSTVTSKIFIFKEILFLTKYLKT
jgi:hypothetical protein